MESSLNLDIPGKVSELETLIKKVLPKNIIYQLLLSKGLEFDGYREFTQNDDAANIDWKATVRSNETLIRKYIEERDLKFFFILDISENMIFGSTEKLKCEYAAELTAALAHLILISGDRVGFILYNDHIVKMRLPELGNKQFDILVNYLSDASIYGGISNLNNILEGLIDALDRTTSMIFIISDFIKLDESYKKNLETLSNLFETVAVIVRDPLDSSFPEINKEVVLENPETGEKLLVNPKVAKLLYEKNSLNQLNFVKNTFVDLNIDFLELSTDRSFSIDFATFLKERISGGRIVKNKNVY
jgi:uncharacterized protein (DUF58 family)